MIVEHHCFSHKNTGGGMTRVGEGGGGLGQIDDAG